ncbi:LTA synthase family protein [Sulfitobacter sp. F26204]|uniref:LTA synthase family protein n=1 Tax=Sulfitobacter sp. F26204 TaxID=2996014 RepID=UPI00225DF60F|nr:LTA synthase family protein [Sulfitobacter sp. F26204]MCX7560981.1 LTA synthase family protein [Sulfitobacter sp. F26204]
MPNLLRGLHRYLRLILPLLVLTLVHRFLVLDLDATYNFGAVYHGAETKIALYKAWWPQNQTAILVGLRSDILFVLIASCLAFIFKSRLTILFLIVLCLFYAANTEHLHYNFSHIRLGTLHMALNPTFIEGSGLTPAFLLNLFAMSAIAVVIYRATHSALVRAFAGFIAAALCGAVYLLPQEFSPLDPGWMQTHPLAFSVRADRTAVGQQDFPTNALDSASLAPLSGDGPVYNVLVVYLEGVSQYSLTTGDMPFLQKLAADNLSFTRYFGNQLQTNNGLYTSLTGHYPNFLGVSSPWDSLHADTPAARAALPNILASRGYTTAFLQSADLAFMQKATHLSQLGFQEVKGREAWTDFHSENGWGIDDLGLFEASLEYIDGLPRDAPWLVSLLTSGTHAPYNVPANFMPEAPSRLRAIRYADLAAEKLIEGLQSRRLLDKTVVVFTADESREPGGRSNLENEILLNWLPLIVAHPNGKRGAIDWPLGATAFRDLALRLAGAWDFHEIDRLNRPNEPLVFGNYYKRRVFWFDRQQGDFYACYTGSFLCAQFTGVTDLTKLAGMKPAAVLREPKMQEIFQRHEAPR